MSGTNLTCDDLDALCRPKGKDYAVLVAVTLLPRLQYQCTTYGRDADRVVEAHKLKEWFKDEIFDGQPPEPVVHESFLRDAARNEERAKVLLDTLKAVHAHCHRSFGSDPSGMAEWGRAEQAVMKRVEDAIALAETPRCDS